MTVNKSVLWAKSLPKNYDEALGNLDGVSLTSHTIYVRDVTEMILEAIRENLPSTINYEELRELAIPSAILHDLGKANNIFQGIVKREEGFLIKGRPIMQPLRHEILSALLIVWMETPVKEWLKTIFEKKPDYWLWMVAWVVGGHHLKFYEDSDYDSNELVRVANIPEEFIFYGSKIAPLLQMISIDSPIPDIHNENIPTDDLSGERWHGSLLAEFILHSEEMSSNLDTTEKQLLAYAKAIIISADVAGSAVSKNSTKKENVLSWIPNSLNNTTSTQDLQKIIEESLRGEERSKTSYSFQDEVEKSRFNVTLVTAGCGNGKTIAAYKWAKQFQNKKLIFTYPTTGTTTAGFAEYLLNQKEIDVALIHSKSQVDLDYILNNGVADDLYQADNFKIDSLRAWGQQIIACTVDTVLCLMQNQRTGLFNFPVILKSAIVFDEIHNYDAKMFGALVNFLRLFPKIPVLLMTASLPECRLKILQSELKERLSEPIRGVQELEEAKRYKITYQEKTDKPKKSKKEKEEAGQEELKRENLRLQWQRVGDELKNSGGKILWVCNTVAEAIEVYKQAEGKLKNLAVEPILYHSRFRYRDRVKIQNRVLEQFRDSGLCFVVATQVCEMSLDISATLMISQLAPFPSLIQRLGRLNRKIENKRGAECYIYHFECQDKRPYAQLELRQSEKIIKEMSQKNQFFSQKDLADELTELQSNEQIKFSTSWDRGVWQSKQEICRDGDSSMTIILEQDLEEIRGKYKRPTTQNVAQWTIPMLYRNTVRFEKTIAGYPVISDEWIQYDEKTGAEWLRKVRK